MAISGKFSSMAAVLLVVAVLAGTCASGADAAFDITNLCNKTINITTSQTNVSLVSGGTVNIDVLPNLFFLGNVTITVSDTIPPVEITIPIPQYILSILDLLGVGVQSIVISCAGDCITLSVTVTILGIKETFPLGPICV